MKNLFIVGAQRSGSTYLYQALDSHPQVSMNHPVRPEPKFFMNERLVAKGKEYYERTYFANRKPRACYLGEKSTSYLESPEAARRMKAFYPDARILMILRDPVQRAYSNYRFSVAHKQEHLSFSEALAAEPERLRSAAFTTSVSPYAYCKRGHYIDYIESYQEVFEKDQLCVLIFEEFVNNLAGVQRLYQWLGVEQDFVPPTLKEVINSATEEKENQQVIFSEIMLSYQDSIARLEAWLGRKVGVWHKHYRELLKGVQT